MATESIFPDPPSPTQAELDECRRSCDFRPILFEWYKYTAIIANIIASIEKNSPTNKPVPNIHYGVMIGLLNRCSRLMLANVALSHQGLFGETTAIVDRCIFESAVKVLWLSKQETGAGFALYISEGLKSELMLKHEIETIIKARNGRQLPIEKRILDSMQEYFNISGLSEQDIKDSKKIPDFFSILKTLGFESLVYVVGQKIGSHHIHGNWPSLLRHYLEWDKDYNFRPRDHNVAPQDDQYVIIPLMVLKASIAFCQWLIKEPEAKQLVGLLDGIEREVMKISREVVGDDFLIDEKT